MGHATRHLRARARACALVCVEGEREGEGETGEGRRRLEDGEGGWEREGGRVGGWEGAEEGEKGRGTFPPNFARPR